MSDIDNVQPHTIDKIAGEDFTEPEMLLDCCTVRNVAMKGSKDSGARR